jgi:hypothetical protein
MSLVQQNADTSLSCHQNNTDSKTSLPYSNVTDIRQSYRGNQQSPTVGTDTICRTNGKVDGGQTTAL